MLRSFMIISGRGGIVLYRKDFAVSLAQPRMIAGLVTALCDFSAAAVGLPVAHIRLDLVAITVVDSPSPAGTADGEDSRLRCAVFHDPSDGELFGRLVASDLLHAFMDAYAAPLAALTSHNPDLFKSFSARVRPALADLITPFMTVLERDVDVHAALLFRHSRAPGVLGHAPDEVWYAGAAAGPSAAAANLPPDLHALVQVADDFLVVAGDTMASVRLGDRVHIRRIRRATLVVVAAVQSPQAEGSRVSQGAAQAAGNETRTVGAPTVSTAAGSPLPQPRSSLSSIPERRHSVSDTVDAAVDVINRLFTVMDGLGA
jgi:hypothetical protein